MEETDTKIVTGGKIFGMNGLLKFLEELPELLRLVARYRYFFVYTNKPKSISEAIPFEGYYLFHIYNKRPMCTAEMWNP